MKVLCFGSCNIDYIYDVEKHVSRGETVISKAMRFDFGGKGLNQAVALRRAGADVSFAGCVGNDGGEIADFLRTEGIDVSNLDTADCKTGTAFIQVENDGERNKVLFDGANAKITKEYADDVLKKFVVGDVVVLQNEIPYVCYIVEAAFERGLKICFNPSPFDEKARRVDLNKITYLILSEADATACFGTDSYEKIESAIKTDYPSLKVLILSAERGAAYYIDGDNCNEYPIPDYGTVDKTAGGDAFAGYFVAEVMRDAALDVAMKRACAATAIAISKKGSSSSMPYFDEVEKQSVKAYDVKKRKNLTAAEKIKAYIYENCATVTLKDVATMLHYSVPYTVNWLSKNLNATFGKLLAEARCCAAAELLVKSDMPIGDVIDKVGYQNESFFRKRFLKKYGVTPLQFRKKGGKVPTEINVISKKKALMNFCVKEGCSDILLTAANDVNDAIEKITGERLGVIKTKNFKGIKDCIVLALFSDDERFDEFFEKESRYLKDSDGYTVKYFGGDVYVLAHCAAGVFYGVHDLLEKNADVVWARGAHEYETEVLKNDNLTFKVYDYTEKSPFAVRVWNLCGTGTDGVDHGDFGTTRYIGRNKFNGVYHHCDDEWYNYGVTGQSLASADFRCIDDLIDEHPEYFMTDDDGVPKRTEELESFTNYYNRDVVKVYAERAVKYLNEKCHKNDILGWNMPDAPWFCMKINGERLDEKTFTCDDGTVVYPEDENYKSTVYFNFINRLIKEINALRPGTLLQTQAYMYSEPAPAIKVDDRVIIKVAPLTANEKVAHDDSVILDNEPTRNNIVKWLKKSNRVCINAYWNSFKGDMYSRPIAEVVQKNLRWWRGIGIYGFTPEGKVDCGNLDDYTPQQAFARKFFDMNEAYTWIINKLAWNPDENVNALKRKFCSVVYKECSAEMEEYYDAIEEGWNSTSAYVWYATGADVYIYQCIIKAGVKDRVLNALGKAVAKAKTPTVAARVKSIYETMSDNIGRYADFVKEEGEFAYCGGVDPLSDEQTDYIGNKNSVWNRAIPQKVLRNYDDMSFYPAEAKFERRMLYDDKYIYFGYLVYDDKIDRLEIIDGKQRLFRNDGTEVISRAETYMGGNSLNQDKIFGYVSGFDGDKIFDHLYESVDIPKEIPMPEGMRDVKRVFFSDNPKERRYFHVQVMPISMFDIAKENFKPYGHFVYYTDRYKRAGWMGFGLWSKQNFTMFTLEKREEK